MDLEKIRKKEKKKNERIKERKMKEKRKKRRMPLIRELETINNESSK